MAPGHVAYGLQAQYGLAVTVDTVASWEHGLSAPSAREVNALAGVLWCSVGELLAQASTLREHRLARGMAPDELARRLGMDPASYVRMEESGQWRGSERQTEALATALVLTPRELLTATGRNEELAGVLREAATGRWQPHVRAVAKMLPLPRHHLEDVLEQLNADYRAGSGMGAGPADAADVLAGVTERFWELVRG
ncbi:helix-turn-helix domain-containing protein [Streptomyces sp. NPDC088725]|uniref:helix-turn-helix domain-containing protein n=1 Tax=Streptomyces sp. NPDC088725 TaxID=3365873 RepID=UPI003817ACCA